MDEKTGMVVMENLPGVCNIPGKNYIRRYAGTRSINFKNSPDLHDKKIYWDFD